MLWFCLVLSLILSSSPIQSEEDGPPSLVNLTEQPIARVHGTVNVITGDWVDQDVHEKPSGPDSYPIGHSYSTSNSSMGNLSDSWDFLWPSVLEYHDFPVDYELDADELAASIWPKPYVILHESGGTEFLFKYAPKDRYYPAFTRSGYTHISSIDHPVTQNPARMSVRKSELNDADWEVTLSDGTKRFFLSRKVNGTHNLFCSTSPVYYYNLVKEILPSQNVRHFDYDKKGDLVAIRTVSSCGKYLIQKIVIRTTPKAIYAKSLDGREVTFELEQVSYNDEQHPVHAFVKSIRRPGVPDRHYTYNDNAYKRWRMDERAWKTGLVEEALYYRGGETLIDGKPVHVPKKDKDFTYRRVSEVRTKRFRGEKTFMKHGFYYDKKDPHGNYRILHAKDADGSRTSYMWNPNHRINWCSYYDKRNRPLAKEHFVWGKGSDRGRLLLRTFYDEQKNPLFVRTWDYSKKGFPKEESWHGLFTRYDIPELTLKDKTTPKGGETITLQATWDDLGHQLTRTDQEGNVVECEYDRCFVSARYTYYKHERIIQREFYKYDSAGCLTKSIVDDGSQKDCHCLEHIRRRYITLIDPRQKAPCFGEPDRIRHKIWTPESGELLTSTEYYERDKKGHVIRHRLVTSDGLEQVTSYSYDDIDRPVETISPDGTFERIVYDDVSGLVKEKSYPQKRIKYKYDLFSRIISEKEIYPDGSFLETTTDYDQSGCTVTVRDTQGNTTVVTKDLLGRVISKKFPQVMTPSGVVTPVEKRTYKGRSVLVTSPTGAVTETVYSSFGKPLNVIHPEGYTTMYIYDLLGRLHESIDGDLWSKTMYDYRGRVVRTETLADYVPIAWQDNHYEGDDLVEVTSELTTTKMKYDPLGRCIEKCVIDKAAKRELVEKTAYDGLGRVIRSESNGVVHLSTYDAFGRAIESKSESVEGRTLLHSTNQYDNVGRVIESAIQQDETTWLRTRTTYGSYGLPSSVEAPDGSITRFVYEQNGAAWIKKTIDPRGVVTEETFMGGKAPLSQRIIDPFGNVLSEQRTFVNCLGAPEKIEYDIYYKGLKETTLTTLLEYDQYGRRTGLREAAGTNEEVRSLKAMMSSAVVSKRPCLPVFTLIYATTERGGSSIRRALMGL